jgi:uncharacterized membrane protein YhiD involved in acid resistance
MFGLSIFDSIKVALIGALVIFCVWLYFDRKADKVKIAQQQVVIENQNSKINIITEKQKTLEAVQKKTQIIRVEVQKSEDKVDPVISGQDGTAVIQLFDNFRSRPQKAVK